MDLQILGNKKWVHDLPGKFSDENLRHSFTRQLKHLQPRRKYELKINHTRTALFQPSLYKGDLSLIWETNNKNISSSRSSWALSNLYNFSIIFSYYLIITKNKTGKERNKRRMKGDSPSIWHELLKQLNEILNTWKK